MGKQGRHQPGWCATVSTQRDAVELPAAMQAATTWSRCSGVTGFCSTQAAPGPPWSPSRPATMQSGNPRVVGDDDERNPARVDMRDDLVTHELAGDKRKSEIQDDGVRRFEIQELER